MNEQNNNIDTLLRAWGTRQAATQEQLNRLRRNVTRQAARSTAPTEHRIWRGYSPWRHALTGLAALAAIAVICYLAGMYWSRPGGDADTIVAAPHALTLEDVRRHTLLLETVQEMFADQWRWVAQYDGEMAMEIDPLPGGVTDRSRPVLVRVTMFSRKPSETEWRKAWETEVMMRSEEFLDLPMDTAYGHRLQLWVHPLGDGNLDVDTGISWERPVAARAQGSYLLSEGKPAEILAVRRDGTEYRVFQEVKMLALSDG